MKKGYYWVPLRIKREWIPDWFFRLFCTGSGVWLLEDQAGKWPWRHILMRESTEFEKRRFAVPIEEASET